MALFNVSTCIPQAEKLEIIRIVAASRKGNKFVTYTIQVNIGDIEWTVDRRYSEFHKFDKQRFCRTKSKRESILPKKKIFNNNDVDHISERQKRLESYLRTVFELDVCLAKSKGLNCLSVPLASFLHFNKYEVHSITRRCTGQAPICRRRWIDAPSNTIYFNMTPVELFAFTERLKLEGPTTSAPIGTSSSPLDEEDLGTLLSFLAEVPCLKITGSNGRFAKSNITPNSLQISLKSFKHLNAIWVLDADCTQMIDFEYVRATVRYLAVHYSVKTISDILKHIPSDSSTTLDSACLWNNCIVANFASNQLETIDGSIANLIVCEHLNVSNNNIKSVGNHLKCLPRLRHLNISYNAIDRLIDWDSVLDISHNNIRSLQGLSKLYSLESLDARNNAILDIEDIIYLHKLPVFVNLMLQGNPVTTAVEYRSRVLQTFGERCFEVRLDHRVTSQREIDMVHVRMALHRVKVERANISANSSNASFTSTAEDTTSHYSLCPEPLPYETEDPSERAQVIDVCTSPIDNEMDGEDEEICASFDERIRIGNQPSISGSEPSTPGDEVITMESTSTD